MSSCGVSERDGKIRECEDDDVLWNEMSVTIIILVLLLLKRPRMSDIKNQKQSGKSHQMKVVNVDPQLNMLMQD